MKIIKSSMKLQRRKSISINSLPTVFTRGYVNKVKCIFSNTLLAVLVTLFVGTTSVTADDLNRAALNDTFPDRYTVVKGDTLWDIAGQFLRDPWRWPEVWQGNPQVNNPDLIFPGDVLVMTFVNGVKLQPTARASAYSDAVPLIDPAAIAGYLNAPLVTDDDELRKAGYVVEGFDNRLILGKYDQFYARKLEGAPLSGDAFRIFRPGRTFVDPISNERLGYEAVHVGDSNLLKPGDPKAPENKNIRGLILETPNKATELGALSVVAINLGERENMKTGDVLRIKSQKVEKIDPISKEQYFIPEENVGLALVFRTFEKVSYALITDTGRQVLPGDIVVSPEAY